MNVRAGEESTIGTGPKTFYIDTGASGTIVKHLSDAEVQSALKVLRDRVASVDKVQFAYIHGSFLEPYPSHDLDLALYLHDMSEEEKLNLCLELSSQLGRETGLPVDVHPIDPEHLGLCFDIIRGLLIFSRNDKLQEEFQEKTILRYMDYRPLLKQVLLDLAGNPGETAKLL
ncbi:MAG: hypothetical protein IMF26_01565 [Candidatus Fermentithermobacillus carboniphilus]|uniref:Polymerase beta nucleotidyltransferase domain-containing protein n=1 Tax=Candidatus Fermentithermobacillus carboniphilus TaxID=3085328 RepID=A0AAT9LCK6_9FIRM|nr:MAG: hypothetical protein IMF26_01565 [Candidatus Fermentithermobacillus carboniphilus]